MCEPPNIRPSIFRGFSPRFFILSVLLTAVFVTGCSGPDSTPYDSLVTPKDVGESWVDVDATEAIERIEMLAYSRIRDSLISNLESPDEITSAVYSVRQDGQMTPVDSSTTSIAIDGSDFAWIRSLLPEQKTFAAERTAETFGYSESGDGSRVTIRVVALPGSDIPGGLRTVDLHYSIPDMKILAIDVYRNGGGLFFREASQALLTLGQDKTGHFQSLDYTVALVLPFREPTAFRTLLAVEITQ